MHFPTMADLKRTEHEYTRSRTEGLNGEFNTSLGKKDSELDCFAHFDRCDSRPQESLTSTGKRGLMSETLNKEPNNIFSISNSYFGSRQKSGTRGSGETPNFKGDDPRSSLNLKKTREIDRDIGKFTEEAHAEKRLFSKKSSTTLDAAMKNKLNFKKTDSKNEPTSSFTIENALKKIKSVESVSESEGNRFRHGSTIENHFSRFEIVSVSEKDGELRSEDSSMIAEKRPVMKRGQSVDEAPRKIRGGLLSESDCSVILQTSDASRPKTKTEGASGEKEARWKEANRRLKKNNTHRLDGGGDKRGAQAARKREEQQDRQFGRNGVETRTRKEAETRPYREKSPREEQAQYNPVSKRRVIRAGAVKREKPELQNSTVSTESTNLKLSNLISKLPKKSRFFSHNPNKKQSKIDQLISSKIQKNLSISQPRNETTCIPEHAILKHKESLIPNNINLSFANTSNAVAVNPSKPAQRIRNTRLNDKARMKTNRSGMSINTIDSVYLNQRTNSASNTRQSNQARVTKYSVEEYNRLSSRSVSLKIDSNGKKHANGVVIRTRTVLPKKKSLVLTPRIIKRTIRSKSEDPVPGRAQIGSMRQWPAHSIGQKGHGAAPKRVVYSTQSPRIVIKGPRKQTVKYLTLDRYIKDNFGTPQKSAKEKPVKTVKRPTEHIVLAGKVRPISLNNDRSPVVRRKLEPNIVYTPKQKSIFSKHPRIRTNKNYDPSMSSNKIQNRHTRIGTTSKSLPLLRNVPDQRVTTANKSVQYLRGLKIIKGPSIVKREIGPSDPGYIDMIDANIRKAKQWKSRRRPVQAHKEKGCHIKRTFAYDTRRRRDDIVAQKENLRTGQNQRDSLRKCKSEMKAEELWGQSEIGQLGNNLVKLLSDTNQTMQVNTVQLGEEHFPGNKPMQRKIRSSFYNKYKDKSVKVGEIDSEIFNSISKMNLDTITERMIENLDLLMKDPAVGEHIQSLGIDRRKFPLFNPEPPEAESKQSTNARTDTGQRSGRERPFNLAVIQPNVVMNIQTGLQNVNCQYGTKCHDPLVPIRRASAQQRIKSQEGFFYKPRRKRNASTNTDDAENENVMNRRYKIKEIVSMVADQIAQNKESTAEPVQAKCDKGIQISRISDNLVEKNVTRASVEAIRTRLEESRELESNKRVLDSKEKQFHLAREIEEEISPFFRKRAKNAKKSKWVRKTTGSSRDNRGEQPFQLKISAHMKNYLHSEVQVSDSSKKERKGEGKSGTWRGKPEESEEVSIQDTQIINHSIRQMGQAGSYPSESEAPESKDFQSCINGQELSRNNGSFMGIGSEGQSKINRFFSSKNISEIDCGVLSRMAKKAKTIEIVKENKHSENRIETLKKITSESGESQVRVVEFRGESESRNADEGAQSEESEQEREQSPEQPEDTHSSNARSTEINLKMKSKEDTKRKRYERITSETFNKMINFKIDNRVKHVQGGATDTFRGLSNEILRGEDMNGVTAKDVGAGPKRTEFLNNVHSLNKFNSASGEIVSGKCTPRDKSGATSTHMERDKLEEIAEKTESNSKSQRTESNTNTGQNFYSSSRKKGEDRQEQAPVAGPGPIGVIQEEIGREDPDNEMSGTGLKEVQSGSTFFIGTREGAEGMLAVNNLISPKNELSTTIGQKFLEHKRKENERKRAEDKREEARKDPKAQKTLFNRIRLKKKTKHEERNLTFGGQKACLGKSKSCSNSFMEESKGPRRRRMISFKEPTENVRKSPEKEQHPRINVDALEKSLSGSSDESAGELEEEPEDKAETRHEQSRYRMSESRSIGKSGLKWKQERESRQETQVKRRRGTGDRQKEMEETRQGQRERRGEARRSRVDVDQMLSHLENQRADWSSIKQKEKQLGYSRVCSLKSSVFLKEFNNDVEKYSSKSLKKHRKEMGKKLTTKKANENAKKRKTTDKGKSEAKKTKSIWKQLRRNNQSNYSSFKRQEAPKQDTGKRRVTQMRVPGRTRNTGGSKVRTLNRKINAMLKTPKARKSQISFKQFSQSTRKSCHIDGKKLTRGAAKKVAKTKQAHTPNQARKTQIGGPSQTTLNKIPGILSKPPIKRRKRGNFTTIDDFSNSLRHAQGSAQNIRNPRKRVRKRGSNKSTLVKLCKPNFSIQSSLSEIKNKIRQDLRTYSKGNMSTRARLPKSRQLLSSKHAQVTRPGEEMETVQVLVSGVVRADFEELFWVDRIGRNSELESIREENDGLTHQDTFSVMNSNTIDLNLENGDNIDSKNTDIYSSKCQDPKVSGRSSPVSSAFENGLRKEINNLLAEAQLSKFKTAVEVFEKGSAEPVKTEVAQWKVQTWAGQSSSSSETFVLKVDAQGQTVNIEQLLSMAREVARVQKNVFEQNPAKVCANMYITELTIKDLVLLRNGDSDTQRIEIINPKTLFALLTIPSSPKKSAQKMSKKSEAKQASGKSNLKTVTSEGESNFYKRVVTEEYNPSGLATTNREHFSFSQIQEQRPSNDQLDSETSKMNSNKKVSLRYINRNSEDLEHHRELASNNVTSLHNSKKLLKNFTSNSSKKYNLYERRLKTGLLRGFVDGRVTDMRRPVLVDYTSFLRVLVQENWTSDDAKDTPQTRFLFEYLFQQNSECAVVAKFTNCRAVFYGEVLSLLSSLWSKAKTVLQTLAGPDGSTDAESLDRLTRSLNVLTLQQKSILGSSEGMSLLTGFFQDDQQDHLELVKMKLVSLPSVSLESYMSEEHFLDDFRVFWELIRSKLDRASTTSPVRVDQTRKSAFDRVGLSTNEKKLNKRENRRIVKAELAREQRRTKKEFKLFYRKIEFIMDEDADRYFELRRNNFDRNEVALAYEDLKCRQSLRANEEPRATRETNCFAEEEESEREAESKSKGLWLNEKILSPTPKSSVVKGVKHGDKRNWKSLSKLGKCGKGLLTMHRTSGRRKFMSKKSMSLEKSRPSNRMNKWLKKPEDIGNCGKKRPMNMRGVQPRDTFYSDHKAYDSLGSGFNPRKSPFRHMLGNPSAVYKSGKSSGPS